MADLKTDLWNALTALPKPVTSDAVLAKADELLKGKENGEFRKWFDKMGPAILSRLNG